MSSATDLDLAGFDPFSAGVIADPYPWYRALHDGPRVFHQEQWGFWVLTRYDDVWAATRDHAHLSSADGVTYVRAPLPMMLTMDPPDHERLRRIVGREFAPRDIHRFRPQIERFVTDGLDEMKQQDTGDVVKSLAVPVPIRIMAAILGVPEADIPELRKMSDDLVQGFAIAPSGSQTIDEAIASYDFGRIGKAITDIHDYFRGLIGARRRQPADDLITKFLDPADEGTLDENELLWFCLLLLVAGIETTTNLIGNMVLAFVAHPEQWELVRERRELVGSAVNEALRFDSPIQGFFRTTLSDYAVGETEIPSGSRVLLSFGAANHDPQHYSDPAMFRADRDPADHLAFGSGIHRCLGAGLAELEGIIVLEQLLDTAQALEIDGDVVRTTNPTLRGAARVPVNTKVWNR
ncbi:MAG: cytochrome P450 [Actinomycetota bacterium]